MKGNTIKFVTNKNMKQRNNKKKQHQPRKTSIRNNSTTTTTQHKKTHVKILENTKGYTET